MIKLIGSLSIMVFSLSGLSTAAASNFQAGADDFWFYMVKTKPSDPSRDAEFNAWYDDVDIPDVLEVPAFVRARRGVEQIITDIPSSNVKDDDSKYVALYDIQTNDIDKSIIDLYVAARKMVALGRLTDVLKVVEANYYRRVAPPFEATSPQSAGQNKYVLIKKILCCNDLITEQQFLDWYGNTFMPEIMGSEGLARADLYRLYRVMEVLTVGPEEIPHFLVVYEIDAESAEQTIRAMIETVKRLDGAGLMSKFYVESESVVYREMSDVKSN